MIGVLIRALGTAAIGAIGQAIGSILGDALGGLIRRKAGLKISTPEPLEVKPPEKPSDLEESRSIDHLHPDLKRRYLALKSDFEARTGRQLFETCTYRSPTKQAELFKIGRRGVEGEKPVTHCDGVEKPSRHNVWPPEALDIAVDTDPGPKKVVSWDAKEYGPLDKLAEDHGLVWGGDWKLKDLPHLELPRKAA